MLVYSSGPWLQTKVFLNIVRGILWDVRHIPVTSWRKEFARTIGAELFYHRFVELSSPVFLVLARIPAVKAAFDDMSLAHEEYVKEVLADMYW